MKKAEEESLLVVDEDDEDIGEGTMMLGPINLVSRIGNCVDTLASVTGTSSFWIQHRSFIRIKINLLSKFFS